MKCEDCGKEIMIEKKSRLYTHKRCYSCIDFYLTAQDFKNALERGSGY